MSSSFSPNTPTTPMYLKLFFPDSDSNTVVKERYVEAIKKHNEKAASLHPDESQGGCFYERYQYG